MTEIFFYHLQRQPLEAVLPPLLEKCLERGWRVVVEVGSPERVEALDALLWTWREESFLPHGTWRDVNAARQPILLVNDASNPNGAPISETDGYRRVVLLFDGNDVEALEAARAAWRRMKGEGHDATYWQQSANGRWEKKA